MLREPQATQGAALGATGDVGEKLFGGPGQ